MCLGRATFSPLPPQDPRTWAFEGTITMVAPDLQGHPSCWGLGRGLLLAGLTTEVSNSTLMERAGGGGSRGGPEFHPNLPLGLTQLLEVEGEGEMRVMVTVGPFSASGSPFLSFSDSAALCYPSSASCRLSHGSTQHT